ncbi:LacI family DNA-binding transcriptional regulator [Microbacterium sp. ASV49]|uniref:LacI family DNA-binding transcriptional regulator n=1 Tax=Microbacterium candidum TaxID=3041922 RepID=A0ABT7MW99_9MICO|nr:LacI family DNA-binding transcriptional regulator [Microbacterium sp. ASV49]MDL9978728.1 LacI family DNA-binding transcriptional regulator [Microbacterium sp. ASV49]
MSRPPTMNDVAQEAGVALKTVSRYVNGEKNINPELAKRIRDAIALLGYRRNLAAASLRPGRSSRMIGLVISDLANPYYSTIARAIETTAAAAGYLLITASSEESAENHDRLIDRFIGQQVDGLIVVPPARPGRSWADVTPPVPPLVVIDRPADATWSDTILADNAGGAHAATAALTAAGAGRIAFVGDTLALYTMSERLRGYRLALEDAGIAFDEDLVVTGAHSADEAASIVSRLLREQRPDAIFAANNRASIGSVLAFRDAGTALPLIGFDDFESARLGTPAVSVATPRIEEMGRLAAERLLARIDGDTSPSTTTVLPVELILRGSERETPTS